MANEIDVLIAQATAQEKQPSKKREYQPAPGEEAIFERQPGMLERISESGVPGAIAAGLVPFSRQFQGKMPWEWNPETVMEGLGWLSGMGVRGRGMPKEAAQKGGAGLRSALEEIGSELFGKGGVPAKIPQGPLPAAIERGFQRKPSGEAAAKYGRSKTKGELTEGKGSKLLGPRKAFEQPASSMRQPSQLSGAIERKLLPKEAGPSKRVFPMEEIAQTPAERLYRKQRLATQRIEDVIEEMLGASLKAKGLIL